MSLSQMNHNPAVFHEVQEYLNNDRGCASLLPDATDDQLQDRIAAHGCTNKECVGMKQPPSLGGGGRS